MVTDTSFFRNRNYHQETDTIDTLDFEKMAEVVRGLHYTLLELLWDHEGPRDVNLRGVAPGSGSHK
jgi:hypothetical protein